MLSIVLPVLEYCSAEWCSAADTHLKILYRIVSGARFLTGGMIEYDIAHRRSVAVQCMLYKVGCKPVHPLHGATWVIGACVGSKRGSGSTSVYLFDSSLQNLTVSVPLCNDPANPVFDGVRLAGFKSRANLFLLA